MEHLYVPSIVLSIVQYLNPPDIPLEVYIIIPIFINEETDSEK